MPLLVTHKQIQDVRHLPFCYLCGKTFEPTDQKNKDHVPPRAVFAKVDRNFPLELPTHLRCNSKHKLIDEKIGQVISLKHGRVPSLKNLRLRFRIFHSSGGAATRGAVVNVDIHGAIRRWLGAFHAALYREPLQAGTRFAIQTPFPEARLSPGAPQVEPVRDQHLVFVQTIKVNRAAKNLDVIRCNNGKLIYECVWDQADDGTWICVFALDIYGWKDLGDVHNFSGRGCAGSYLLPSGTAPLPSSKGTKLHAPVPNYDVLDPFGG